MKKAYLIIFLLVLAKALIAQTVSGRVVDANGEPLAYVTVAEEQQSIGATTSIDGAYKLDLKGQGGELTFRYIGYEVLRKRIENQNGEVELNITLKEATYDLAVATVSSNAEDPAYRIMREAAARREQYLLENDRYQAEVYIKGILQVDEAPEKIFGQEIGDMGGLLDSSRAGIVYLSETYSTVYIEQPDRFRENITASKVSGDPRGYSFNTVAGVDFELYRKVSEFGKPILSPLAENAAQTYRFRLEGSRRDEKGKLIYRIDVRPRSAEAAAYRGTIIIQDESFHLLDADLYLLGNTIASPGLDTLHIGQGYRQRNGRWEVYQRQVKPHLKLLAFRFSGAFTAVYQSYTYDPVWDSSPFNRIKTQIAQDANQVDSTVWEARPIPLTRVEVRDYEKKDSIRQVVESPVYRDSVEQKRNELGPDALLGYSFSNWRKQTTWRYSSPLEDLSYHPVPGLLLGASVGFSKELGEHQEQEFDINAGLRYGIGDEEFYPHVETSFRLDKLDNQKITLRAARELVDIHRDNPVSWTWNSTANLFFRANPLKLYERRMVEFSHETKLRKPGTRNSQPPLADMTHRVRYEDRFSRVNTTSYSFFRREQEVDSNLPLADETGIDEEAMLIYEGNISYVPGQQFMSRPDAYISLGSAWPTFDFNWRMGASVEDGGLNERFAFVGLSARKDALKIGRVGLLSARAATTVQLLRNPDVALVDHILFAGNPIPVNTFTDYLTRFLALDPYAYATDGSSFQAAVEHDFNGAIWSKLPLLNKLRWEVVVRGATLHTSDDRNGYQELGVGLSNIGFGLTRFIRVDGVWSRDNNGWNKPALVVGLNISVEDLMAAQ